MVLRGSLPYLSQPCVNQSEQEKRKEKTELHVDTTVLDVVRIMLTFTFFSIS